MPVHMFVDGTVLLFGGMGLDEHGRLLGKEDDEKLVHQAAHINFHNSKWKSCDACELLHGLTKPFTANVAVEDERKIYIRNPKEETVLVKVNDILVIAGNQIHGGMTYIYDEIEEVPKYYPSLHFVFQSKRFKKMKDVVGVPELIKVETYVHPVQMADISDEDLKGKIEASREAFCELGIEAFEETKVWWISGLRL